MMEFLKNLFSKSNLIKSAETGNVEKAKKLIQKGVDVNAKDKESWTALMVAALHSKTEMAKLLIENGADVNAKSNTGNTALIVAVEYGRTEIVKLLLDNRADMNMKGGEKGETALWYALNKSDPFYQIYPHEREEIAKLLIAKGAKVKNYENEMIKFQSLPALIRNCIHFWIMGPEKPCSICGKVESFPPPHGCQKCGLLLCESCYGFICSLTD